MDKKRIWSKAWMGAIVAAFVAAIGIFAVMLQVERKALSEYERGVIYVAAGRIPKGEVITEKNCEKFLKRMELDQKVIPSMALVNPEQLVGLTARIAIDEGTLLTEGMFERQSEALAGMEHPVIASFKAEDLYQVVGGVLRASDRIHIYTVAEDGLASLIWEAVYVEQVFDSGGNAIAGDDAGSSAQRINVYLDAGEVEQFYTELARGALRVVKVCE